MVVSLAMTPQILVYFLVVLIHVLSIAAWTNPVDADALKSLTNYWYGPSDWNGADPCGSSWMQKFTSDFYNIVKYTFDLETSKDYLNWRLWIYHITTQVKGTMVSKDSINACLNLFHFSFGVVLLEIVTGEVPIDKGRYIVKEVKDAMDMTKDLYNLHEILDPAESTQRFKPDHTKWGDTFLYFYEKKLSHIAHKLYPKDENFFF
ncbi:uncharacterized protein LOC114077592 [Solanum pennellii]|uniref:Uncharacterized protein LOC114077592 n=1 Tax=Solanum pennellii TaxID=28526 RepID=A0ABM1VD41_SOLPN|nr:uncharacterized protein LOC114077592 [Solanum pennellii]